MESVCLERSFGKVDGECFCWSQVGTRMARVVGWNGFRHGEENRESVSCWSWLSSRVLSANCLSQLVPQGDKYSLPSLDSK